MHDLQRETSEIRPGAYKCRHFCPCKFEVYGNVPHTVFYAKQYFTQKSNAFSNAYNVQYEASSKWNLGIRF
eukprot:1913576-Pleurochrysis_carterae.AAC.1